MASALETGRVDAGVVESRKGKHSSPRRILSASKEEWKAWDAAAVAHFPHTWAEWTRRVLNAAAAGLVEVPPPPLPRRAQIVQPAEAFLLHESSARIVETVKCGRCRMRVGLSRRLTVGSPVKCPNCEARIMHPLERQRMEPLDAMRIRQCLELGTGDDFDRLRRCIASGKSNPELTLIRTIVRQLVESGRPEDLERVRALVGGEVEP